MKTKTVVIYFVRINRGPKWVLGKLPVLGLHLSINLYSVQNLQFLVGIEHPIDCSEDLDLYQIKTET